MWSFGINVFQAFFFKDVLYLYLDINKIYSLGNRLHTMAARVFWRTHRHHADGTKGEILEESKTEDLCYIVVYGDPKEVNLLYNWGKHIPHANVGINNTGSRDVGVGMIEF